MKRTSRKIFALLLAAALLIGTLQTAVLAAEGNQAAGVCPTIYVHGFMSESVYTDQNDPSSPEVFPDGAQEILDAIKPALPDIAGALARQDWEAFGDKAAAVALELLSPAFLGEDGEVQNGSGVFFVYPKKEDITPGSTLRFSYDWRADPMDSAAKLNDFVNYVCDAAGVQKVNMFGHSLGGLIMHTYFTLYGTDHVRSVCFNTAAIYGETYTGELMNGDLLISADALTGYLRFLADENDYPVLLDGLVTLLEQSGIAALVERMGNGLLEKIRDTLQRRVMLPLFANWPSIWSMVPDDYVDGAIDYVFNGFYAGEDHSALREKVDAYNTQVRAHREETLLALNEAANVYVISRYGSMSFPLTTSYRNLSDSVIDTKFSSFGATTGRFNEPLPEDYRATVPAGYLSPDGTVDASTCLFPEQTWFVRGLHHSSHPDAMEEMIYTLLYYDGQATVDTFEMYPRFMYYEYQTDTFAPDVSAPAPQFGDRLRAGFREFTALLKDLFDRLLSRLKDAFRIK
ncbi:MAG: alpha/beta fold hydrolase [Clostridia bacterium]|nr:alpha/beta fold hydrolase [Clostridia bacterium]